MRTVIALLSAATAFAQSSVGGFNYNKGGRDWDILYDTNDSMCNDYSREQSPIALSTKKDVVRDKDLAIDPRDFGSNSVAERVKTQTSHETNWQFDFKYWNDKDLAEDNKSLTAATVVRTEGTGRSTTYTPQHIEWHTPAEHKVDSTFYDAEA